MQEQSTGEISTRTKSAVTRPSAIAVAGATTADSTAVKRRGFIGDEEDAGAGRSARAPATPSLIKLGSREKVKQTSDCIPPPKL